MDGTQEPGDPDTTRTSSWPGPASPPAAPASAGDGRTQRHPWVAANSSSLDVVPGRTSDPYPRPRNAHIGKAHRLAIRVGGRRGSRRSPRRVPGGAWCGLRVPRPQPRVPVNFPVRPVSRLRGCGHVHASRSLFSHGVRGCSNGPTSGVCARPRRCRGRSARRLRATRSARASTCRTTARLRGDNRVTTGDGISVVSPFPRKWVPVDHSLDRSERTHAKHPVASSRK